MEEGKLKPPPPSVTVEGPASGYADGFAPGWTRQKLEDLSRNHSVLYSEILWHQASCRRASLQLNPTAAEFSPAKPAKQMLGEMTGRWPESSSENSFGSLNARDGR